MSFAAFIMTYNRSNIILDTIQKLLNQTYSPERILVVDNSEDYQTQHIVENLAHPRVEYYRVGYNSGPAGAAKIGLQKLAFEGFDWIYWGDDDSPPQENTVFETIFKIIPLITDKDIGQIGAVGHKFNHLMGKILRTKDNNLLHTTFVKVENIAGGQTKIIQSAVVKAGVIPEEKLFFGFEELDFDLKLKKKGFTSYVASNLFLKERVKYNRLGNASIKPILSPVRQYYSTRNLLYILYKNKYYMGLISTSTRLLIKLIYFTFFSFENSERKIEAKFIWLGFLDFFRGKYGKLIL